MNDPIIQHIVELKAEVASLAAKQDRLNEDMREHMRHSAQTRAEIDRVQSDLDKAKGSLNIMQWLVGSGVLTSLVFIFLKH